jgi:hypothetical protein
MLAFAVYGVVTCRPVEQPANALASAPAAELRITQVVPPVASIGRHQR